MKDFLWGMLVFSAFLLSLTVWGSLLCISTFIVPHGCEISSIWDIIRWIIFVITFIFILGTPFGLIVYFECRD